LGQKHSESGEDLFFSRERLFSGQKDTPNPVKTILFFCFFRERLLLGQKDTVKTYFSLENACFWN